MTSVSRTSHLHAASHEHALPQARRYEVRHGDTLSRIAAAHGVTLGALIAANPQVRNPDVIYPGSMLHLPEAARPSHYEVKHGDTLLQIAADHGLSLHALLAANPQIRNPNLIHVGDTLQLPALGDVAGSLPAGAAGPWRGLLDALMPVYRLDPAYRRASANGSVHPGHGHADNAGGADPAGQREATQRLDLRRFTDPSLGSSALAAIVIGNAEGTRRPDGGFTRAYGGHTDPGNAVHNRGSFSYQHAASSPADADRRQLATLRAQLPAYEAAARRAGLDPSNARLASAYLDLYNQSPSAAGRFLHQLGTLRGRPLDEAHITDLRVHSFVDASTGRRFALPNGGHAGSGFVNIARHQLGRTPTEAEVQAVIRADQQRRTHAVETALRRQGLLNAAPAAAPATASGRAARVLGIARGELGTKEIRGARDNPRVIEYHQATSLKAKSDETAWCSAFVNWTMKQAGVQGTNSAAARSWLQWGTSVPRDAAHVKPGDVIVFPRGNNPTQGHVAIVEEVLANGRVKVIGGNQGTGRGQPDGVTESIRSLSESIGVRRAP